MEILIHNCIYMNFLFYILKFYREEKRSSNNNDNKRRFLKENRQTYPQESEIIVYI